MNQALKFWKMIELESRRIDAGFQTSAKCLFQNKRTLLMKVNSYVIGIISNNDHVSIGAPSLIYTCIEIFISKTSLP